MDSTVKAFTIRRLSYELKAERCAEIKTFDIPFAVKEYLQNAIGQVLKAKRVMEWDAWAKEDLRGQEDAAKLKRKKWVAETFPGMMTGPHGATLAKKDGWLPAYILSTTIPVDELADDYAVQRMTPLKICIVLWHHSSATAGEGTTALSFFNNHLDDDDSRDNFENFVVDGQSTSAEDPYAIGEKGKGFVLATQYLFEKTKKTGDDASRTLGKVPGVSFRIGNCVGDVEWKKTRKIGLRRRVHVMMDYLAPLNVQQYLRHYNQEHLERANWPTDSERAQKTLYNIYSRRISYKMSKLRTEPLTTGPAGSALRPAPGGGAGTKISDPRDEVKIAGTDEVSITIFGLKGLLEPEFVFSGIFNICAPPKFWRVPGTDFVFFMPEAKSKMSSTFFLRDQIVPFGPATNHLGINYHGHLEISSDRRCICLDGPAFEEYQGELSSVVDIAFGKPQFADLAYELATDILTSGKHGGIRHVLQPTRSEQSRQGYHDAFQRAFKELNTKILDNADEAVMDIDDEARYFPISSLNSGDAALIHELGLTPYETSETVVTILRQSGAYPAIKSYAETVLLQSPSLKEAIATGRRPPGDSSIPTRMFKRVNNGILDVVSACFPHAPDDIEFEVKDYSRSFPKVIWVSGAEKFVMGLPDECPVHTAEGQDCLCHVGTYLSEAVKSFKDKEKARGKYDVNILTAAVKFRAQTKCMLGVRSNMLEPKAKSKKPRRAREWEDRSVQTEAEKERASEDRTIPVIDLESNSEEGASSDEMEIGATTFGVIIPVEGFPRTQSSISPGPVPPTPPKSLPVNPQQTTITTPVAAANDLLEPSPISRRLSTTLTDMLQEVRDLEADREALRRQVESLTQASDHSRQREAELQSKIDGLLRQTEDLSGRLINSDEESTLLRGELEKAKAEVEGMKKKLKSFKKLQAMVNAMASAGGEDVEKEVEMEEEQEGDGVGDERERKRQRQM